MDNQASKTQYAKIIKCAYVTVIICLSFTFNVTEAITIIATTSVAVHATVLDPNALITPPPPNDNGGGGFSSELNSTAKGGIISLSGKFAPNTTITLLFSGIPSQQVITNSNGLFALKASHLADGVYVIVLLAKDVNDATASQTSVSYTVYVNSATETVISNITFPPLYYDTGVSYIQGETIVLSGKAIASTSVGIMFDETILSLVDTDQTGYFKQSLKGKFSLGKHFVTFRQIIGSTTFPFGKSSEISLVRKNVQKIKKSACGSKADFSNDCRVNLIDFSILAYWNNRSNFPEKLDLNKDGKIDLKDFSIMAYYWTG